MKPRRALLTLACALGCLGLAVGCSEDPTSPGTGSPLEIPLATAEIGPTGGDLQIDAFKLVVPPGAFNETVTLAVYPGEPAPAFGPDSTQTIFKLGGIPDNYAAPLSVQLRYTGIVSGPSWMAVGEELFTSSKAAVRRAWRVMPATSDTGWCHYVLPALPVGDPRGKSHGQGITLHFVPAHDQVSHETSAGHFRVVYPRDLVLESDVTALGDRLEEAYQIFRDMGFTYTQRRRWPVEVTVRPFIDEEIQLPGFACTSQMGNDHTWLEFNFRTLSDEALLRMTAGHEFCHLIQTFYDPRPPAERANQAGQHLWLDEAMAVWSEEMFTDVETYVPPIRQGHEMRPFNGMQAGAGADPQEAQYHGYGMAALIKYIVLRWDVTVLPTIYQNLAQGSHPVEAVGTGVGFATHQWWDDFLLAYILSPIYDLAGEMVLAHHSGEFLVAGAADTQATFPADYHDLSGRLYSVRLENPDLAPDAELQLKVGNDDFVISALSYETPTSFEFAGEGTFILTVSDLHELSVAQRNVLLLISNTSSDPPSYTGTRQADLSMQIRDPLPVPSFDSFWLNVHFHAFWRDAEDNYWETPSHAVFLQGSQGIFSGSTFFATWDSTSAQGVHRTGAFSVDLNPGDLSLETWEFYDRRDFPDGITFHITSGRGGRIPVGEQLPDQFSYGISGPGTCSPGPMENVYHLQVQGGVITKELWYFDCDANSYFDVTLRVESSK